MVSHSQLFQWWKTPWPEQHCKRSIKLRPIEKFSPHWSWWWWWCWLVGVGELFLFPIVCPNKHQKISDISLILFHINTQIRGKNRKFSLIKVSHVKQCNWQKQVKRIFALDLKPYWLGRKQKKNREGLAGVCLRNKSD